MASCQHNFGAKRTAKAEWSSSLINLLRTGRASGEKATSCGVKKDDAMNETISTICLVVDNAKAHRSLSDSSSTFATTPSSSLNDTDDYRTLLESMFEDDGSDGDDWASAQKFHNSYPAPSHRGKKGSHSRGSDNFSRWASSSDPEIWRTTLDDMLRDDAVSRRNVPRPVRQRSIEGLTSEDVTADQHCMKDHCPTLVQRQRTLSFDGL